VNWGTGATLGAAVLGIGLVAYNLVGWWPGRKALMKYPASMLELSPFVLGYCFGTLAILCGGGLLGYLADFTLWAGGWAGDGALIWGVGGYRENVSRGPEQALTNGGHAVVLILCFVLAAVLRRKGSTSKQLKHGIVAGVMLGTVRGIAGLMAIPLASSVNIAGAWLSTGVLH
jgi:hypothetical protein